MLLFKRVDHRHRATLRLLRNRREVNSSRYPSERRVHPQTPHLSHTTMMVKAGLCLLPIEMLSKGHSGTQRQPALSLIRSGLRRPTFSNRLVLNAINQSAFRCVPIRSRLQAFRTFSKRQIVLSSQHHSFFPLIILSNVHMNHEMDCLSDVCARSR